MAPHRPRWLAMLAFVVVVAVPREAAPQPRAQAARFAAAEARDTAPGVGAGRAFLFSALVPGAGQRMLGQSRWVPYLALEAWAWLTYFDRAREGRALERRYRDLAWSVARLVSSGPRRDGAFEYYEAMGKYVASGAYDAEPLVPGLQPEEDPTTFNGSIWHLARSIYLPAGADPADTESLEYFQALNYYAQNATPPPFAWSWRGSPLAQQRFRELIHESDESLREATTMLGLILANHMVSAVDAFITARMRAAHGGSPGIQIESGLRPDADMLLFTMSLRIPVPWR